MSGSPDKREFDQPDSSDALASRFGADGSGDPSDMPAGGINAELDAELADHLASSAADMVRHGEAEESAARRALTQFGDLVRIKRQCWWIHQGEEVMFRAVGIGLLGLLTVAVVTVAIGGWQVQRNLASRTDVLSEQLASLTATQREMLAQQRPPEITGKCYLGDRSKPAAGVEISVYRFAEYPREGSGGMSIARRGVVTRRVRTDSEGRFATGGLAEGDYCLIAPLQSPAGQDNQKMLPFKSLQSRPAFLLTGGGAETIDLDLLPDAQIELVCDSSIPATLQIGESQFAFQVSLYLYPSTADADFPISPGAEAANQNWPLPGNAGEGPVGMVNAAVSEVPYVAHLPSCDYTMGVNLQVLKIVKPTAQGENDTSASDFSSVGGRVTTVAAGLEDMVGPYRTYAPLISHHQSKVGECTIAPGGQVRIRLSCAGKPMNEQIPSLIEQVTKMYKGSEKNLHPNAIATNVFELLFRSVQIDINVEPLPPANP